jgi:hypothetical protein
MRKNFSLLLVFVCLLNVSGFAQTKRFAGKASLKSAPGKLAVENGARLPIRRVILYSNGVAYIERRGTVSGNAEINLSFKQSQVDDVLKSMVVLDLGKDSKIGAVSYNSSAPVAARMAEIPFSVGAVTGEGGGLAGVLAQLQGARVAVATDKGAATGSILTVERKQIRTEKETTSTSVLVLVSETGELSSFDLSLIRSVKLLDEGARRDISEFASATASTRRVDAKTITVTSEGTGEREMIVSYTIAAPIWKTTYRVVLDEAGKPFFQGWAIVDNISEEDWQNVQLSLISGTPISFIQPIQQPFYRYRPIVPIPSDLKVQPQIYEEGGSVASNVISGMVVDANGAVVPNANVTITNNSNGQRFSLRADGGGNFSQAGLAGGNYTVSVNAPGFNTTNVRDVRTGSNLRYELQVGSVSSVVEVTAGQVQNLPAQGRNFSQLALLQGGVAQNNSFVADGVQTSISTALSSENAGVKTAAVGEEIGDLFEYRIAQPVTVLRDRSALIPIVQTKMDGERVAVYNEAVRTDRPYSGVLLKNLTNLTLENGSLTVIDGDAYAGEALMERLKPKEQRIISFALDLGTSVRVRQVQDREAAKLIKIVNGTFQVHYFTTNEKLYQITNQTNRKKVLYIEYPVRSGWQLSEKTPKPDYTTQRYHRFRVELEPFAEKEITVGERQPLADNYALTSLTRPQLELFLSKRYIDAATKAKLEKLIDLQIQMAQIDQKLESFDDEEETISADQKRLRENIEALSKTAEAKSLIARYIQKADAQESRLEQIEKERKSLQQQREQIEAQLAAEIRAFQLERSAVE